MDFLDKELIRKLKTYYPQLNDSNQEEVENALICVISGFKKSFAEKIRELRTESKEKLNQADTAEKLNVTYATYSAWENGKSTPRLTKLVDICNLFKINASELIEDNPVSPDKIFDRRVPLLDLDFFKAKPFSEVFRNLTIDTDTAYKKIMSDEFGAYDFAVKVEESDNQNIPANSIAFCSLKELSGKESIEQMKVASGKIALVTIVFDKVCLRKIQFDGKFLHVQKLDNESGENVFPLSLSDISELDDPEKAKWCGYPTPAGYVQIFGIVKKTVQIY